MAYYFSVYIGVMIFSRGHIYRPLEKPTKVINTRYTMRLKKYKTVLLCWANKTIILPQD